MCRSCRCIGSYPVSTSDFAGLYTHDSTISEKKKLDFISHLEEKKSSGRRTVQKTFVKLPKSLHAGSISFKQPYRVGKRKGVTGCMLKTVLLPSMDRKSALAA